jgi:hypothetical protein
VSFPRERRCWSLGSAAARIAARVRGWFCTGGESRRGWGGAPLMLSYRGWGPLTGQTGFQIKMSIVLGLFRPYLFIYAPNFNLHFPVALILSNPTCMHALLTKSIVARWICSKTRRAS